MLTADTEFPSGKILVFYGRGSFCHDFVMKHCLAGARVPMPDYFCDDYLEEGATSYLDRPLVSWNAVAERHSPDELIVVVMALSGGNLAIPGKKAREWEFADIRIGRCLDMRYELEARKAAGELREIQNLWTDGESKTVFDFATENLANGGIWCRSIYAPNPYFGNDIITEVRAGEVYVDAGANLGEDMMRLAAMNPGYGRMVGFEPDARIFGKLAESIDIPRAEVRRQGLSDQHGCAAFDASGMFGRLTDETDGKDSVEIVRLDDCGIGGVSLIKMDVEGGEAAALRGSAAIIAEHRPRLAISAYHKASDLFELPRIILELRPDYRLHLRQHSVFTSGTVLYAV